MASTLTAAQVYERYIEYAANLQRVDASMRRKARALLKKVEDELIEQLMDADPSGALRQASKDLRTQQLIKQVRASITKDYKSLSGGMIDDLKDLSRVEASFAAGTINSYIGVELLSTTLTPSLLTQLAKNTLIMGAPSSEWWSRQSASLTMRFSDQIRRGMAQGETVSQLSQRIRGTSTGRRIGYTTESGRQRFATEFQGGIMDISRREADALVRSSVQAVSQATRIETYEQNDDVVKGIKALVVLDARTTQTCMALSGQSWTLKGEPLDGSGPFPGYPPYHFNCRTTMVPVLFSWEELASGDKKAIARKADKAAMSVKTIQASMDKPVDGDLDYESWLKTKDKKFQQEILGPGKYRLWEAGKITFRDLIDQTNNPLTVAQLQERFG